MSLVWLVVGYGRITDNSILTYSHSVKRNIDIRDNRHLRPSNTLILFGDLIIFHNKFRI